MKIGILTYGRIANFGANLQSTSTYMYLLKQGHTPIYIYYLPKQLYNSIEKYKEITPQIQAHYDYFDTVVKNRTDLCHSPEDINRTIKENGIEAVIIGADAVLQHHPLLSRIKYSKGLIPFTIEKVTKDRLFPNLFWGYGIENRIKMAMMSVSCQNSDYKLFTPIDKRKMRQALERFGYISVRDSWTKKMINHIEKSRAVDITPDPVFAFNYNMASIIPSKDIIRKKYNLPEDYVVISLFKQSLTENCLESIKKKFCEKGIACVVLPMPIQGVNFKHTFDYVINAPLSPLDWYSIIKYSKGYIGENMHPIVTCLHNGVPCYSIDNWGSKGFFNQNKNNGSSKTEDIMRIFGVETWRRPIVGQTCNIDGYEIVDAISNFPVQNVKEKSSAYLGQYLEMMENILKYFTES